MMQIFDKGLQLRMGQAHVRQWTDEILPLLEGDEDPLGVDDLTTHQLPLDRGARAPTRCSRRRKTGRSRSCSSPDSVVDRVLLGISSLGGVVERCSEPF